MKRLLISAIILAALAYSQSRPGYDPLLGTITSSSGGGSGTGTVTSVAAGCGLSGGTITATGTLAASVGIDSQTGAGAFAIPTVDCGKLISRNQAAAVLDTIAAAGSTGFLTGWYSDYQCRGAGGCTITPATSTIDGSASLGLSAGQGVRIVSDGANYVTQRAVSVPIATAATANTIPERNTLAEVIAANTVATGKTPMATDTNLAVTQIPSALITPIKMAASTFDTQSDGATVTWAIASVKDAQATLTFTAHSGSRTLNITNPVIGGNYVLKLIQDGTGGEGLTLGTGCTWKVANGGAGAVTLSAGASALDVLSFIYDGTNCLASFLANLN